MRPSLYCTMFHCQTHLESVLLRVRSVLLGLVKPSNLYSPRITLPDVKRWHHSATGRFGISDYWSVGYLYVIPMDLYNCRNDDFLKSAHHLFTNLVPESEVNLAYSVARVDLLMHRVN